jgi:hypothetical protein
VCNIKNSIFLVSILFISINSNAQDSLFTNKTFLQRATTIPTVIHKPRMVVVSSAYVLGWAGSITALSSIWYPKNDRGPFHQFKDFGEWNQIDKVGHFYSAYRLGLGYSSCLQWAGLDKKRSVYIGALSGIVSQSVIEILDGYQKKYGFSIGDMVANTTGSGLYALEYALWQEQRIRPRISWHRNSYPPGELKDRARALFGATEFELGFKDYNAQTYWLSTNLWSFAKQSKLPKWLNIAVGYGVENIYGGFKNEWYDANNVWHDRNDIKRQRQFYIAPDIDWSKIKTKSKIFNSIITLFNIKTPLPTIEFNSSGKIVFHPLYY